MKKIFRKAIASLLAAVMILCAIPLSGIAGVDFSAPFTIEANAASVPEFEIIKTSQEGNNVSVAVNLISGTFNVIDFQFNTSDGVKCDSINVSGDVMGVGNTANCSVSAISTSNVNLGTVITAAFTVPEDEDYSISGFASDCAVTTTNANGEIVNNKVSPIISGSVSRESPVLTIPEFRIVKTSQEENEVTVAVNLVSGTFNALDFKFNASAGVTCTSINASGDAMGVGNKANGTVSLISTGIVNPGTIITATFTVLENSDYLISGAALTCAVVTTNENGGKVNHYVTPIINGSVSGRYVKTPDVTVPGLRIVKTSQEGNKVTVAVNLVSGTFNAMDFRFNMSEGVKCCSINFSGNVMGVGNTSNGTVSAISTNSVNLGTVIIAAFTVPEDTDYSISGSASNCVVTTTNEYGEAVNCSVTPTISGTVSGRYAPSRQCGENVLWALDKDTGILTISGTGAMYSYYSGNSPFYNNSFIKTVIIEDGVTNISNYAFYNCHSLESVSIPDSLETIGVSAFSYCSRLEEIELGSNVSIIERNAFDECTGLTSINIPDSVTYIDDYAFSGTSLTELIIPNSVDAVGRGILRYNNTLESLTVPFIGQNRSDNSTLSYIFSGTGYDYNESVPETLKTVNITDASIIGNNAFRDCYNIENITLNNGLRTIKSYAFYYCTGLKEIDISDTVGNINDCAFNGCKGLKEIDLGNSRYLQINYNVFDRCDNVERYSVGSVSENYSCDESGVLYNKDKTGLIKYPAGNSRTEFTVSSNVSYINENAFENSKNLKHVYLPENIMSIGEYAFRNCTALEEIIIPKGTYTVCHAAFEGCKAVKEITIPEELTVLGNYAFNGCTALEKVNYNAKNLNSDTGRDACFKNCGTESSGIDFVFGESVETIPESLLNGWNYYYYKNVDDDQIIAYSWDGHMVSDWQESVGANVVSVTIGSNVKTINYDAFFYLTSLSELKYNAVDCSFNGSVFSDCSSLTNVVISDKVKTIPSYFLTYCNALTDIEIPVNITEIGDFAFSGCNNLERVKFNSSEYIDIGNDIFNSSYKAVICCYENSYMHFYAESNVLKYCIMDEADNPSFTVRNDVLISYNGTAENVYISSASKIGFGAFSGNDTVKSIELSSDVTRIFNQAFKNCSDLEKVIIPKSVTSIGEDVFTGCENVKIWCYPGSYAEAYAANHEIPVEYIILVIDENRITIGDSESVYIHTSYNTEIIDTQSVTWTSSDSSVASVSKDGKVTAEDFGTAVITATTKDGLTSTCIVNVDVKLKEDVKAEISNGIISGDSLISKSPEEIENLFANENVSVSSENGTVGTGDVITVFNADGEVYKEMTVIIFGDVNRDGWYDGTDSIIVNCLANGMLSKEQADKAVYLAADCNHDGIIDNADVAILEQAGLILAGVDQTKSEAELMEDVAFVKYLSLIDQSPAEEIIIENISAVISEADEKADDENAAVNNTEKDKTPTDTFSADKSEEMPVDETVSRSFIQRIIDFITYLFKMMKSFIPKF